MDLSIYNSIFALLEKGIWCKSNTVPAAVNSLKSYAYLPLFINGKAHNRSKSEDLPINRCLEFREKGS